mmetsp:Transcript_11541/g.29093  ORF Transcript_11541/g.29093 Transcript_11541/m.29093 type:complete len:202 (-) Transcript_11541:194-799(-)
MAYLLNPEQSPRDHDYCKGHEVAHVHEQEGQQQQPKAQEAGCVARVVAGHGNCGQLSHLLHDIKCSCHVALHAVGGVHGNGGQVGVSSAAPDCLPDVSQNRPWVSAVEVPSAMLSGEEGLQGAGESVEQRVDALHVLWWHPLAGQTPDLLHVLSEQADTPVASPPPIVGCCRSEDQQQALSRGEGRQQRRRQQRRAGAHRS